LGISPNPEEIIYNYDISRFCQGEKDRKKITTEYTEKNITHRDHREKEKKYVVFSTHNPKSNLTMKRTKYTKR